MENGGRGENMCDPTADLMSIVPLVEEYEHLIAALKDQILYYKKEHSDIRKEIKKIVGENEDLRGQLQNVLHRKNDVGSSNIAEISNLQQQMHYIIEEKNTALELLQLTQKEVDSLERQLRGNEEQNTFVENDKRVQELAYELERQERSFAEERDELQQIIHKQKFDLENSLHQNKISLDQVDMLQKEILELEDKLASLSSCHHGCQTTLGAVKHQLETFECREKSYLSQITSLTVERDNLLLREKSNLANIDSLKAALDEVIQEASKRVTNEIETMNQEYNARILQISNDFEQLKNEHQNKSALVEKLKFDIKVLEDQLNVYRKQNGMDEFEKTVQELQNKLTASVNKVMVAERKNAQLVTELTDLKCDMERMAQNYDRDISLRDMDNAKLANRFELLQEEYKLTNKNFLRAVHDNNIASERIGLLQNEVKRLRDKEHRYQKLCTDYQTLDDEQILNTKFLKSHVEIQSDLNNRYKQNNPIPSKMIQWKDACKEQIKPFEMITNLINLIISRH